MKGIILAGGSGSRLFPLTLSVSKQLLPVYDKPMIYYPLSMLMLAGIREILLISTHSDLGAFKRLLGDGKHLGLALQYKEQAKPNGLAEAYIIGKEFIGSSNSCLILGDNIFFGQGLPRLLKKAAKSRRGALVFAYKVQDPQRYGVIEFTHEGKAISLEEKPQNPKSNYAVPGIYFYDSRVTDYAASLRPSDRGELEITDLNKIYLENNELEVVELGRGMAWLDAGTHESLLQAGNFVQTVQDRQGLMIACLEEIAYNEGYINKDELADLISEISDTNYKKYLQLLISDES